MFNYLPSSPDHPDIWGDEHGILSELLTTLRCGTEYILQAAVIQALHFFCLYILCKVESKLSFTSLVHFSFIRNFSRFTCALGEITTRPASTTVYGVERVCPGRQDGT